MKPKVLKEEVMFEGPTTKALLAKVQFPNGSTAEWDFMEGTDVVVMLPIDKDNNVYLVKEWRIAWKDFVL